MKPYVANVINMIADRACIQLTEDQAIALIKDTGYEDEIVEFEGETVWDTAPRETLIDALCLKITGRAMWSNGEIMVNYEGYDVWLESYITQAVAYGYEIVED